MPTTEVMEKQANSIPRTLMNAIEKLEEAHSTLKNLIGHGAETEKPSLDGATLFGLGNEIDDLATSIRELAHSISRAVDGRQII